MLVLHGVELIFFYSSKYRDMIWICVENSWRHKDVFITAEQLTQCQGCLCFSLHPTCQWAEGAQGDTQLGQGTPTDHRDIPHHKAPCSTCKSGGRKRNRATFRKMEFVIQSNLQMWWSPGLPEMDEYLLPMGIGKWIPAYTSTLRFRH